MLFDEIKRRNLMRAFLALPEGERTAYRALAVVFVPVGIVAFTAVLTRADVATPAPPLKWNVQRDTTPMLVRWEKLGLVARKRFMSGEKWTCSPLMTEPAAREAWSNGEFEKFDAAAGEVLMFGGGRFVHHCESVPHYLRVLRNAFYRGDAEGYAMAVAVEVQNGKSRSGFLKGVDPFVEILANPLDLKMLLVLPPEMGRRAFESLLPAFFADAAGFKRLFEAFGAFCGRYPSDPELRAVWADYAMLAGRADEALRVREKSESAEMFALEALASLMQGDPAKALSLYEDGLRHLRKATGKRRIAFRSWAGVFYPVLLLAAGVPVKRAADYLEATAVAGTNLSSASVSFLYAFVEPGAKNADFFDAIRAFDEKPECCVDIFFFLLYACWLDMDRAREYRKPAEMAFRRLEALGLDFLTAELAVLIRELWPELAKKYAGVPVPRHPLKNLMIRQSEWERSLSALSGIGVKTGPSPARGSKRFAWEISWTSRDRHPSWVTLTPVEQTLRPAGWSKGKNVALRRLYRKTDTISSMTDQDHRAVSAIREDRSYYGTEYRIDVAQALEALAGHPYLFRGEDGSRVEVVTDEPQLMAVSDSGNYHLRLSPFPRERVAPQHIVREDGPNCLRVTRFEDRHLKMAAILGEEGLLVPARAKETLLKALGSLASVVTIHSDIEGVEVNAEQVEADTRIYVQIQPSDEGLDVDMVVRPLGPDSVPCRPGVGGNNIFGLVNSKRLQARRGLDEEKDALMLAIRGCPALMDAEQVADERWHLRTSELSLEFLLQIQELGDSVVVEWPKGQTMHVRSPVPISSMSMAVRDTPDWFSISGELRVDEQLVLNMKDLMALLRLGHGRFLPLGDGQFVALTQEFRRRLEALSMLGDQRGNELRVSPLAAGQLAPLLDGVGAFKGSAEWKRQLRLVDEASKLEPSLPSTFRGDLRHYQLEGYRWLARLAHWNAGACLADDMGLGKTIQALALLVARGNDGPALVVAPTSVCSNWIEEARRFAPTLVMKELRNGDRGRTLSELEPLDVVVATYGLLQNEIDLLSAVSWHTIVLDEAQAIKNMATRRSMAAMKLNGDFRMATTGTPIENHLGELWNLFRFLNPHFLGSLESFNRRFATPIERDGDRDARMRLKKAIQPFILRRNKEQVLEELPPKTEVTLRVELKEEEHAFYEMLRRNAIEELSTQDASDRRFKIFAELMRLRRACCNVALVMPERAGADGRKFPSAKLEAFGEILAELRENGHKALVFSQFVDHLAILRGDLDAKGIAYQYLDGSTPPQERARRVQAFQAGEGECFLISLKAGGTGLNLTAADYVIHMDPWWNPAVEEQASDRAHRIGQDRPVTVYRIVAKGTVEEKIVDLHAWKRDLAESLLEETEVPLRLSAEEMMELIRDAG